MAGSLFEKLDANFTSLPMAAGKNVFLSAEYAKACGLGARTVRERLQHLAVEGKVRRVNTKRDGRLVSAWEYLGE